MNNFEYENQLGTVHLVYHIQPQEEVDTFVLGMLCNNEIHGVAKTIFTQIDSDRFVKYNVSSKIAVSRFFDGPVNKKRLIGVFSGIVDAMLAVEEYMIDQRALLLDLDYIFTDVSTYDTVMICLPLIRDGGDSVPDMSVFFKNVIFSTKFDQTENCDHVAQILNYLNSNPTLSLNDFKKLLDELSKTQEPTKVAKPVAAVSKSNQVSAAEPVPQAVVSASSNPVKQKIDYQHAPVQSHVSPQIGVATMQVERPVDSTQTEVNNPPATDQVSEEKPMSLMYLLRHYSKENAAAYKAQKGKKKENKPASAGVSKPNQSEAGSQTQRNNGFAVPTTAESVNPSFAVPGQQPIAPRPVATQEKTGAAQAVAPRKDGISGNQNYSRTVPATPINFGETTVLGGGQIGETTVLGTTTEPARIDPHLIRIKNNEKIPLSKPVFRIGKERSYVDYFIGDNTAISRSHANIINDNGEFFVVDTNSTNHTYVNGGMIQSNVQTKLSHGTKIRLANEDFEFRLY